MTSPAVATAPIQPHTGGTSSPAGGRTTRATSSQPESGEARRCRPVGARRRCTRQPGDPVDSTVRECADLYGLTVEDTPPGLGELLESESPVTEHAVQRQHVLTNRLIRKRGT